MSFSKNNGLTTFRNESNNKWKTEALFVEFNKVDALYTLKKEAYMGKPSLYQLYMAMEDITEHSFAKKYLGGWSHWCRLTKTKFFRAILKEWREELEIKLVAKGLDTLKDALTDESAKMSDRMFAAKFFANRGWDAALNKSNTPSKELRPKEEKVNLVTMTSFASKDIQEDYERLMGRGQTNSNGSKLPS